MAFNSLVLIIKNNTNDSFLIEELYSPSVHSNDTFYRHFGFWEDKKGLEIFEPDIYQRRLDMNNTILVVLYPVNNLLKF